MRECLLRYHHNVIFQIAKAEKLKPMEVELKKLEDLSESIVNDFAYMRAREEEMRDTNGTIILRCSFSADSTLSLCAVAFLKLT